MSISRSVGRKRALFAAVSLVAAAVAADHAKAASVTWNGAGANDNMSNGVNWVGLASPANGDSLTFAGGTRLTPQNDIVGLSVTGVTFASGAGSFSVGGANALTLDGTISQESANNQTLGVGLILDATTSNINVTGGGALTLGNLTFGNAPASTGVSTLNINNTVTNSTVTVRTGVATANTINIADGATWNTTGAVAIGQPPTSASNMPTNLTVAGAGTWNVTTASNASFNVGVGSGNNNFGQAQHVLDMTGLANFVYSTGATGTGVFGVGNLVTRPTSTARLANTSNSITAATIGIGDSNQSGGNNSGGTTTLFLGAGTNVLNTGTMTIGATKGNGALTFQTTTGTATIQGQAGAGTRVGTITVGRGSSATDTNAARTMNLAGHNVTVMANNVILGHLNGSTGGTTRGNVTFDTGTFDVNNLTIGLDQAGSAPNGAGGTFTLGTDGSSTGVLNVNTSFLMGNVTSAVASAKNNLSTFTINGGTANIGADITTFKNVAATGTTQTSTINLNDGTLNMTGKSIGTFAAPLTAVNLTGGSLANAGKISALTTTVGGTAISGAPVFVIPENGVLNSSGLTLSSGAGVEGGGASVGQVNGDVTVGSGARVAPGTASAAGTLQFNNNLTFNGGSTAKFKLTNAPGAGNDLVNVGGNLTLGGGTVTLDIGALGAGPQIGQEYTLFNYTGALTGDETNFSVTGPGSRTTFTVVPTSTTPNQIKLSVGGGSPLALVWIGNVNSNWDVGSTGTSNWQNPSLASDKFFNLDTVTFDDTSTNNSPVQIVGSPQPGSVTVNASRDYTFAGAGGIVGNTPLTKSGGGTLVVTNNNSYTGNTDIQAGTVQIGDGGTSGSLGSGAINNNGLLVYKRSDAVTVANVISGGGAMRIDSGVVTLSGANTHGGTTTIKPAATLKVGSSSALGAVGGGDITIESGGTLDVGGLAASFGGPTTLTGDRNVHVSGTGVGGIGALANTGPNQLWAFQNVILDADTLAKGARMDIGRNINSTRTLDLQSHTLTVEMSGTNPIFSILGGTTVTAGNIVANGPGGFNIEGDASVPASGGAITYNTGAVAQFFRTTDGTILRPMVFQGNNIIGGGSNTGTVPTVNSPMLLNGNVTLEGMGSGIPNATANNPIVLKGVINGTGGITKLGPFIATLAGANTYTGGTTITTGTLRLTENGTLGSGNVTNNATLEALTNTAVADIDGTGTTAIGDGSGAITVSANHVRQAALNLADATTLVVNPSSLATGVSKVNAYTLAGGAKLDLKDNKLITNVAAGVSSGGIYSGVQGDVQRASNFGAWDQPGLTTSMPDAVAGLTTIGIATGEQIRGLGPTDTDTFAGQVITGATTIAMYTYAGDANLDGTIDGGDYGIIDNFAQIPGADGYANGDFNYDSVIDGGDYGIIDNNAQAQGAPFPTSGAVAGASLSGVTAVPEPASMSVLGLAAAALLARRRRRHLQH